MDYTTKTAIKTKKSTKKEKLWYNSSMMIVAIVLLLFGNLIVVVDATYNNNRRRTSSVSFISKSTNYNHNHKRRQPTQPTQFFLSQQDHKKSSRLYENNKKEEEQRSTSMNDVLSFLPFFANQQKATQKRKEEKEEKKNLQQQQEKTIPPPTATTTVTTTTRMPLGTIFDSRDYIFTTATNIRSYEWTIKQAGELFEDLYDAAFGISMMNTNNDNNKDSSDRMRINNDDDSSSTMFSSSSSSLSCYELGQIVIVPYQKELWDTALYGIGQRYDVYDGQQRIVTLCLLLAALRDTFRGEYGMKDTVDEITDNLLYPAKVRKQSLPRMDLVRKNQNIPFQQIIQGTTNNNSNNSNDDDTTTATSNNDSSSSGKQQQESNKKSTITKSTTKSNTNNRIVDNYEWLLERISQSFTGENSKAQRIQFLDYLLENVYLLVCIPESDYIARNIVLGQSKGMDNEPIDDFKGLVCFRYTQKEDAMYDVFERWDNLASVPSSSSVSDDDDKNRDASSSVGRDIIATTCRLRTMAALRRKIGKNQEEVKAMELWLKQTLWYQNSNNKNAALIVDGKDFFLQQIQPACSILYMFRTLELENMLQYCDCSSEETGNTVQLQMTFKSRLRFLQSLVTNFAVTKDIEMVLVEALLVMKTNNNNNNKDSSITMKDMDDFFALLELTAMEFIMMKPTPTRRLQRCFELLDTLFLVVFKNNDNKKDGLLFSTAKQELMQKEVTVDETTTITTTTTSSFSNSLLQWLVTNDFGSTTTGKRMAMALLERMNTHLLIEDNTNLEIPDAFFDTTANNYVETILPPRATKKRVDDDELYWIRQWTNYDRNTWVYKLANLCLLSSGNNKKKKWIALSFPKKRERYQEELLWPLTNALINEKDWNSESISNQQIVLQELLHAIWGLSSSPSKQQQNDTITSSSSSSSSSSMDNNENEEVSKEQENDTITSSSSSSLMDNNENEEVSKQQENDAITSSSSSSLMDNNENKDVVEDNNNNDDDRTIETTSATTTTTTTASMATTTIAATTSHLSSLSNIVKGTKLEYYWDDEHQWCKARVMEEPIVIQSNNDKNEMMVTLYFEQDSFLEKGIVLRSDSTSSATPDETDGITKTRWRII